MTDTWYLLLSGRGQGWARNCLWTWWSLVGGIPGWWGRKGWGREMQFYWFCDTSQREQKGEESQWPLLSVLAGGAHRCPAFGCRLPFLPEGCPASQDCSAPTHIQLGTPEAGDGRRWASCFTCLIWFVFKFATSSARALSPLCKWRS